MSVRRYKNCVVSEPLGVETMHRVQGCWVQGLCGVSVGFIHANVQFQPLLLNHNDPACFGELKAAAAALAACLGTAYGKRLW